MNTKEVIHFLWNSNSVWSWILDIILAFLIVKFLFYPAVGLVFGTRYPIVAVVSGSMEHNGAFDNWWTKSPADCGNRVCTQADFYAKYNITKEDFLKFPLHNGFNKGDLIVLRGKKPSDIKVGDIIVFNMDKQEPIIHRVIKKFYNTNVKKYYFQTKGDHNPFSFYSELQTSQDEILGVAWFRIPYLGYIKIDFVNFLKSLHLVR